MKGKKKEIYDSGICKLCHNIKDAIKKQFDDPEEHWEKKKCPKCGDDVWIYHGENLEAIADVALNVNYIQSVDKKEEIWFPDLI